MTDWHECPQFKRDDEIIIAITEIKSLVKTLDQRLLKIEKFLTDNGVTERLVKCETEMMGLIAFRERVRGTIIRIGVALFVAGIVGAVGILWLYGPK